MLKKSLFVIAAVAMLAVSVQAGTIKTHAWPQIYVKQELTTIPVVMDVGYWINVKNQGSNRIKLEQVDTTSFEGSKTIQVENNFCAELTCSISPDGPISGKFTCDFGDGVDEVILAPVEGASSHNVSVWAYLRGANLRAQTPKNNVTVAQVKIFVRPTTCPDA